MRKTLALIRRELIAYFSSPLAYVVLFAFLLYNGFWFWVIVSFLNRPETQAMHPLRLLFGGTIFFWLLMLFLLPVIMMRLLAEERRSGTLEVLLTSPVSETQVVIGKFLAAFVFYLFLWLPTVAYVAILASYSNIDWRPVATGYLGIALMGLLFSSVGLVTSALTRNQIVAAIFSFLLLALLFGVPIVQNLATDPALKNALTYVSLWDHMEDFSRGLVDSRHFVYQLSFTAFFLFLAVKALEASKGR